MNSTPFFVAYNPATDFFKVATATPEVSIGNVTENSIRVARLYQEAANQNVNVVVFPEMCLTGYTIADLVARPSTQNAVLQALVSLQTLSQDEATALIVGFPIRVNNALYNAAALICGGKILGVVPKRGLPNYREFYDKRWFQTWTKSHPNTVTIAGEAIPFGVDLVFDLAGVRVGIEICEDLWEAQPPHQKLIANGAQIIFNPSASPESAAKSSYRRNLVQMASGSGVCGYVYVSSDHSESTADVVMSGHAIIAANGGVLAERPALTPRLPRVLVADIDVSALVHDRIKNSNFPNDADYRVITGELKKLPLQLIKKPDPHPFVPKGGREQILERLNTLSNIQALGLASKLRSLPQQKLVLGLSGGLDSTLALLVAIKAADFLDLPASQVIHTLTMPGRASSNRTQDNAQNLAAVLQVPNEVIEIDQLSRDQLLAISHAGGQDVTYENTQARIRQALVFNKANQLGALTLGTGDLSEAALGWCTYGGDQTSGYHVNATIPKTLVRSLVSHLAQELPLAAQSLVTDILQTPVSPELVGDGSDIVQETEDIVGPYELHDFFLYHFLRFSSSKAKIGFLAESAFTGVYDRETIWKWLELFFRRFSHNQWKRQTMPDGPKVGLSLNPRGDWRMPPDAPAVALW